ncbi:MAG TPA: SsrA-binding protein [Flavobacteriales bacterium]|nr:SsrA-binding protein [Flavobacteriales bacterium]|tara:strand:- start:15955 stop:16407 length:453 start_codon:yes stop_codon:yes gene_type:complete
MSGKNKINIVNRKARFEYEFLETFIAGIVLTGTEIKSIRNGKASIAEAYCFIKDGELYIKNMYIAEYEQGTYNNHDPRRVRKLLLNKHELKKLERKKKDVGITIIPVRLFINDKGLAKLEIALAKGKKLHDKRESIKERDVKRDLARKYK